jgi:hypothetical protein
MRCTAWILAFCIFHKAFTQNDSTKSIFRLGGQLHYGTIFAHSPEVENTAGSYPWGLQLEANWQKISEKVWQNCLCYPQSGLVFSYYNYDNAVLGHSLQVGYFLEPTFYLSKRLQFTLRGIAGFSYLTNPFDSIKNPNNRSYSLPMSAYLNVAGGLQVRVNKFWHFQWQINYQHISNGGIKDPNKGINWITTSVGLLYTLHPFEIPQRPKTPFQPHPEWEREAFLFLSNKGAGVGQKERFMIFGAGGQIHKQIGRLSIVGGGTEVYWDGSLQERIRQANLSQNAWRWGVFAGHQFALGRFRFTQHLGLYLYNDTDFFHWWYHRWGLTYQVWQKWKVGFSMKAHRHIANFLDIRLLKSF